MEMYAWLMVGFHQRDGLRSVIMMYGGQFVTTAGEMSMLQLFAPNWGMAPKVSGKQIMDACSQYSQGTIFLLQWLVIFFQAHDNFDHPLLDTLKSCLMACRHKL